MSDYRSRRSFRRRSPSPQRWYSDSSDEKRRGPLPRRHRYDSPPKESAMVASMHGLTDQPIASLRTIRELNTAASAAAASSRTEQQRTAKELYIGNIPVGIPILTLIDRINTILVDMGATVMPGKPILSGWLGGEGGQFAFVEFRTSQECSNAMSLNGYLFDGSPLRVGRPRSSAAAITGDTSMLEDTAVFSGVTQFSLDNMPGLGFAIQQPLEESGKIEKLALVGAPLEAPREELEKILTDFGELSQCDVVDSFLLKRRTLVFEFSDVDYQRKCVYKSERFRYDRDHHLAVVRQDEAIMRGYISIPNQEVSHGLGRSDDGARIVATRIVWFVNFPMNVNERELEDELRSECAQFGQVENVALMNVERDRIKLQEGMGVHATSLGDTEIVAIVAFKDLHAAIKCKKYISGAKCFYFCGDRYAASDFSVFENNMKPFELLKESDANDPILTPTVKHGKVISVEQELVARSVHSRKKTKIAPEDQEIID